MKSLYKLFIKFHVWVYRMTSGMLMSRFGDMEILLLSTRGRKTGQIHTVPLTYIDKGGEYYLAASAGGKPTHPAWYFNMVEMDTVLVQIKDQEIMARVEVLLGTERERVWHEFLKLSEVYAQYQAKTDREIPIVRLVPVMEETV